MLLTFWFSTLIFLCHYQVLLGPCPSNAIIWILTEECTLTCSKLNIWLKSEICESFPFISLKEQWTITCFKNPLFQKWISLQPFPIQKNILLGFANKIKFLALTEVRSNSTTCLVEIYKGFQKFIKGKKCRQSFKFLKF